MSVDVIIPTVPPRRRMLGEAVQSVLEQTYAANAVIISTDTERRGAGPTRQAGLMRATSEWSAFLDDDDLLLPHHLETLMRAAEEKHADVVFPWFTVEGGTDPFPMHEGRQWDAADPHIFPITALVRTELAQKSHFPVPEWGHADWAGDDFPFWLAISEMGGRFHHVPERTWIWRHWGGNSSGVPSKVPWDAS